MSENSAMESVGSTSTVEDEPSVSTTTPSSCSPTAQSSSTIKDNYYLPTKNHGDFAELKDDAASSLSLSLYLPMYRKTQISIHPPPKKRKADKAPTGLRLEVGNHWINKRLSSSDVNVSSRLLLPKHEIRKYMLPWMDVGRCRACQNRDGVRVRIWDLDTRSEHQLSLKQWKSGCFLLTSNWNTEFVRRRSLHEGDSIWLSWDSQNERFLFHKLNAKS